MEFGGYPGFYHALSHLDLPCSPWLSTPQVPFPAGFPQILPSQRQLVLESSLAPASIPCFQRRPQGQGYIWTSLPRAGGAGRDLGLCAAALVASGSVYLPGAACSQILGGPGSGTAQVLAVLFFPHQNWVWWSQCNVGTLLYLG